MAVSDQIERIKTNIANAYTAIEEKGVVTTTAKNSDNLASTISAIQTGGTGGGGESTTEQYGIIFDEVNDSGIPTKITYNLGLFSQVPTFMVNTLAQVSHLRFKGEAIRRIQGSQLRREVVAGLKLLIIPASVSTLVLDLWAFEQPTMYMVFEGDVPPSVSVNGFDNATCDIIVVHPDNANPEDWSDLIASVSISNNSATYSYFVNDILGGVDPWDSVIYE